LKTPEMEVALATHFGIRRNLIVPNISWGMFNHECDLTVVTASGYATEIEIKVSKADLIKDKEKGHGHYSNLIKKLYFAIPEKLKPHIEHVPERAGVLIVGKHKETHWKKYWVKELRKPVVNKTAVPLTESKQFQVARLGQMRVWGLKEKIIALSEENAEFRKKLKREVAE